jgi:hypothetical protein
MTTDHEELWDEDSLPWDAAVVSAAVVSVRHINRQRAPGKARRKYRRQVPAVVGAETQTPAKRGLGGR